MHFSPTPLQVDAAQTTLYTYAFNRQLQKETLQFAQTIILNEPGTLTNDPGKLLIVNGSLSIDVDNKLKEAGYRYGTDTQQQIENLLFSAEEHLLTATMEYHLFPAGLCSVPGVQRSQLISQLLNYFCAHDQWINFFEKEAAFLAAHKNATPAIYSNDQASFERFLSYKRFIPVLDFLKGQNKTGLLHFFKEVSGVWAYLPGCFIHQITPGKIWRYSQGYVYWINETDNRSNELDILEIQLFKDFLLKQSC